MMFRIIFGAVLFLGGVTGWFLAAAPGAIMGSMKDDYVKAMEEGGIDMTKCKARQKSILDPSGGMAQCAQDVFVEVERQIREAEEYEADSRAEEPSYDYSTEAPPAEE
jgi:hypothetical protein